jgi:hypothetical protein
MTMLLLDALCAVLRALLGEAACAILDALARVDAVHDYADDEVWG